MNGPLGRVLAVQTPKRPLSLYAHFARLESAFLSTKRTSTGGTDSVLAALMQQALPGLSVENLGRPQILVVYTSREWRRRQASDDC